MAASSAAKSSSAVRMCKDLGALWPGCVVTKMKIACMQNMNTNAAGTITYANNDQYTLMGSIFQPFTKFGHNNVAQLGADFDSGSGGTSIAANLPVGFAKMAALYLRYCVLRLQYRVKLHFIPAPQTPQAYNTTTCIRAYTRPFDSTESQLQAPATEANMDQNLCQPNVKQRFPRNTGKIGSAVSLGTYPTPADAYPTCMIKGSLWPHRTLDEAWSTYISSDLNFGTTAAGGALPSDYSMLEIAWRNHLPELHTAANDGMQNIFIVWAETQLVFTVLFKDPIANQT